MTWSNIKAVGYISTESSINKAQGTIQLKAFLDSFVHEFAVQSSKYITNAKEAPFAYGERQLPSIICPILARYTDAFIAELPVNRKWSGIKNESYEDSHGWIDYWCNYRDIDFIIEVKQSFDSLRTDKIRKDTEYKWSEANNQLAVIRKEAKSWCMSSKGFFLIALYIIPFYEALKAEQLTEDYDYSKDLLSRQETFISSLNPKPNWSSVWMLNDKLATSCIEKNSKSNIFYPGVLFLSRASAMIKK